MIKISVFTKDESSTLLGEFNCCHVTIFDKMKISIMMEISITTGISEQLKLIELLIKNYVLFEVQGETITLIPESNNFQRVNFRFEVQPKQ